MFATFARRIAPAAAFIARESWACITSQQLWLGVLLGAAVLVSLGCRPASAQVALQTLPPNTVFGRIGVGQYGPGGAIPRSTLSNSLGIGVPAHSIPIGKGAAVGGFNNIAPSAPGQILIDQGSGNDPQFKPMTGSCTLDVNGVTSCASLGGGTRVVVSACDAIDSSDCFKTVAVNYSAGVAMETLPSTSGFPSGCPIWLVNTGSRGVGFAGSFWPAMSLNQPILYPGQSLAIQNINGTWRAIVVPGRYRVNGVNVYVDAINGSANTSGVYADGLAPAEGAFATPSQAFGFVYSTVDTIGSYPTIWLTAQTPLAECDTLQGQITGTNVGFIKGYGGNAIWSTSGPGCSSSKAALNIGDGAQWELQDITFVVNCSGCYGIFLHQHGVADILSGVHFTGSASNIVAIGSDHGGFLNLSSGSNMNITGTITAFLALGQGTQVNLGPMNLTFNGTVAMSTLMQIGGAGTNINTSTFSYSGSVPVGLVRDGCNGPSMISLNGQAFPGSAGTPAHGCQVF
ncbi:hypothetical protein [Bradyrhizobium sp. RT3a]|uniref:hypothetical protein n=1 Tax=unclassified Bradyrhizobium TaxID=2631580 RepID=UPI00339B0A5B